VGQKIMKRVEMSAKAKLKHSGDKSCFLFQTILNKKCITHVTYTYLF
jgi:hypothetical protein